MIYIVICTAALLVSALTLFSGFGLGTLLMPVFALFFPLEVAVAATAIVHLLNNIFKAALLGRHAVYGIVARFALPAAAAAVVGALLLNHLIGISPITQYTLAGRLCVVTWTKLVIAVMIMGFAVIQLTPGLEELSFDKRYVPLGGIISGFFGGLSGHQGALRTAFLIRLGLSKEAFLGTMVLSAVAVDVSRLLVYGLTFFARDFDVMKTQGGFGLVAAGTLAAFAGTFIGARLIKKITLRALQVIVGILLLALSIGLGIGFV